MCVKLGGREKEGVLERERERGDRKKLCGNNTIREHCDSNTHAMEIGVFQR